MKNKFISKIKELFPVSIKDTLTLIVIILISVLILNILQLINGNDTYTSSISDAYISSIFVLMVMIVSRLTNGYLYGMVASFIGVLGINYVYTYPYFKLNFSIPGYHIAFAATFITAIITSTMTTRIKRQEHFYVESEKEKLKTALFRSVSHDVRTPLTNIIGSASAILENGNAISEEKKREFLYQIKEQAEGLIRLVENLLFITRINNNGAIINKNPEVAEEIISDAIIKFKKQFPQPVDISFAIPEEIIIVPMDGILIEQVIINILENALTHGETTTKINFSLKKIDNEAEFSITDNGVGISPEILPNLFKKSFSISSKKADSKKNLGIGLSVCMDIITAHNGKMTAKNNPDGGANFTFTLPLAKEE